jgi:hypothetical protein
MAIKPGEDTRTGSGFQNAGSDSGPSGFVKPDYTPIKFSGVPQSAMPASINWQGRIARDIRVKLCVPNLYTAGTLGGGPQFGSTRPFENIGGPASHSGGIIFPFTPTISYNNQASYSNVAPTHTNFNNYFFKNSHTTPISITGKFTCQNEYEASLILAVQHLLRTLTKMRWGDDKGAGSPPPVCKLFAYGNSMLHDVPVAVQSWKLDLPNDVDYIQVGDGIKDYGVNFVPVSCSLTLELIPVYSRQQQLDYSVDKFNKGLMGDSGYL